MTYRVAQKPVSHCRILNKSLKHANESRFVVNCQVLSRGLKYSVCDLNLCVTTQLQIISSP